MPITHPMQLDGRPWVRWWWFNTKIEESTIAEQLTWFEANGFGGVEIAWVYPIGDEAGPRYLDEEFQELLSFSITTCKNLGIGCDLTLGTLWPFSGSFLKEEHTSRTFEGFSQERINRSWEARYTEEGAPLLDHLNSVAVTAYGEYHLKRGFSRFAKMLPMSFFSDSWEVDTRDLAFEGYQKEFLSRYGYPYNPETASVEQRYDWRKLLSERTLEHFFAPFTELANSAGALARVQCHGAPTDLLAAYALADIPESETLLFDPRFSLLAASAAAFGGKKLVSSESFTCLYGWVPSPASPPGIKEEQVGDLRAIADAQFAWGVNRVVYHGAPLEPHEFYATVHVGKDGALAPHLSTFNAYLRQISELLSCGESVSNLAILLPLEDQWMADELPDALKKPSSHFYWELQELSYSPDLAPYRPLYFSPLWVDELRYERGILHYRGRPLGALLVDTEYLEAATLKALLSLKDQGAPISFAQLPKEPGTVRDSLYAELLARVEVQEHVSAEPLLSCSEPLDFWCRKEGSRYILFIAHPAMQHLRYPMPYHFSEDFAPVELLAHFNTPQNTYELALAFPHNTSLLFVIDDFHRSVEPIELPRFF